MFGKFGQRLIRLISIGNKKDYFRPLYSKNYAIYPAKGLVWITL